jgi:hypothetical protein
MAAPQGDRTFTMTLALINGVLDETLTVTVDDGHGHKNNVAHQKLHGRKSKQLYRECMKDPSKFSQSHIADPDHPTIIMREGGGKTDVVTFVCFEPFTIFFDPHPEIIEDNENSPDGPFTDSGGHVVTMAISQVVAGVNTAGPYTVTADASKQNFWKFSVVTQSGYRIDPCIITDP